MTWGVDEKTAAAEAAAGHRAAILRAARQCFAQKGFQATSMSEIARCSGISVGHIYNFFSGKQELIAAIISDGMGKFYEMLRRVELAEDSCEAYLTDLKGLLDYLSDSEEAALSVEIIAASVRDPQVRQVVQSADEEIHACLCRMFANGRKPEELPTDFPMLVDIYMSALRGLFYRGLCNRNFHAQEFHDSVRDWALVLFGRKDSLRFY